jgi:hypothetical protein
MQNIFLSFYPFCHIKPLFVRSNITLKYEGRLQSSWTYLITPSRNVVEVRWRSLFRSTSLDKRCTSYNAPPTSRKHAADRWSLRNFLPRSSLFMVGKAQISHGARSELNSVSGLEKPRNRMGWDLNWILCPAWIKWIGGTPSEHPPYSPDLTPCDFWAFPTMKRGSSEARNFEVMNGLQHVFEKWVERCKKCIACQGRYFEKRPSPHLHKVPTRSNKVSLWTLPTALVHLN